MEHFSLVYFDERISVARDMISARATSFIQRRDPARFGLKFNDAKSDCDSRKMATGYIINTIQMIFQVPFQLID